MKYGGRKPVPFQGVYGSVAKKQSDTDGQSITIKKYANRRLYNTATSSYVTLDHLAEMVKDDVDFSVFDAKTGEDITRSVLTHIIVEQESKGQHLLPTSFLRHVISFYGDSLEALVPKYLDHTMQSFASNQENMREYMNNAFGGMSPFAAMEEIGKQNAALLDSTMKMFSPYYQGSNSGANSGPQDAHSSNGPRVTEAESQELASLREQLNAMQKRLDNMTDGQD